MSYLREQGFDVTVISSPGAELDLVGRREQVRTVGIPMERDISPARDTRALIEMTRTLRQLRPHIINASTSKAGLLGIAAARMVGVPRRVYLLRGLRLETEHGLKREILGAAERVAVACADEVICVSHSLRRNFIAGGYAPEAKCRVLGSGSSNGIEIERFEPTAERVSQAAALRDELGIPRDAPLIGFIGRPVADKGIAELLAAFRMVLGYFPSARLMLVGAGFADDHYAPAMERALAETPNLVLVGRVEEPAPYYVMMDVLAFPSHREGFPNTILEAAAAGVPAVGARVTGVVDGIVDGTTGTLVDVRNAGQLADALVRYLGDRDLRRRHGSAGRNRAVREFSREIVWSRWNDEYRRLIRITA